MQLDMGLALEFEKSDAVRKLRLLLSELLFIISQIKDSKEVFYEKPSELFENEVYLEEVADVLCIAQTELPSLMRVTEVAEALLHLKNGAWLLCRLVANIPDSFLEVCTSLVANGEKQDEDVIGGRRRSEALQMLCEMNPSQAMAVRDLCVEHCRMPGVAVAVTLHHTKRLSNDDIKSNSHSQNNISDLVAFVSGLLLGGDANIRNWFAQFVRNGQKKKSEQRKSMVHELRKELLHQLSEILPPCGELPEEQVVPAGAFIRLYCALKGIAAMRFNDEEVSLLLRIVTCQPPATASGVRFVSLGLCMLLACPHLLGNADQERIAIDWIRWLVKEEAYFERASGINASFGEMLLLIAIHFHSNQTGAIAELVSSMLGMKSAVKANALARMKTIFTQEIFSEQVVTAHAVRVPVTPSLNANITGFLAVHCIYQLLKSRAFSKNKVPIKDWIYKQMCSSTTPIHPLLPSLIEVYVSSIILPSAKSDYINEPISEKQVLAVFEHSVMKGPVDITSADRMDVDDHGRLQCSFTAQLLLLYYLLLYQDAKLSNMKAIGNRRLHTYSQTLIAQIPVRYLLQQAQKEQQLYAGLFSPLLRLLATHFPHLCIVEDWVDEEMNQQMDVSSFTRISSRIVSFENLQDGFDSVMTCPSQLTMILAHLLSMPSSELIIFAGVFTSNLKKLLKPEIPRKLLDLARKVWCRFNTVMPRQLWVMTVNALCSQTNHPITKMNQDDLTIDPLLVLRCDSRIFRCPPFLEIILRILSAFLRASRMHLNNHITETPDQVANIQEREELCCALIVAQESAVVQILLESCLPIYSEKDSGNLLCEQREVCCLVCSYLHQLFIVEPNLVKILHFQGYPRELLPLTVSGIPSVHICLDFIPELLSQPDIEKQIFAVELVSYLSLQYALPKSMNIAKLAVNVMTTLLTVLSFGSRPYFFLRTLSSFVRICKAFPPLCDDIVSLLVQLGRITNSNLASISNTSGLESLPFVSNREDSMEILSIPQDGFQDQFGMFAKYRELSYQVEVTFSDITRKTIVTNGIY